MDPQHPRQKKATGTLCTVLLIRQSGMPAYNENIGGRLGTLDTPPADLDTYWKGIFSPVIMRNHSVNSPSRGGGAFTRSIVHGVV